MQKSPPDITMDPATGNQIPRDFIRLLPSDMHPPIPQRTAPTMMTTDAALNNTNVDLLTEPCLNMALNLVVRFENEKPVVNSEMFLFIRFEIRAGLSPGKNIHRQRISEPRRRMPWSSVDGFAVLSSPALLSSLGDIAVFFISSILLKRQNPDHVSQRRVKQGIRRCGPRPGAAPVPPVSGFLFLFDLHEDTK
jgi:hypothetical protein